MIALLLVIVGLAALVLGLWCAWTATRLDRLHLQVASARAGLAESLLRRSAAANDLALSGRLDPASSLALADAANAARDHGEDEWQTQSELTAVVRIVRGAGQVDGDVELDRATREVSMARRIHNDLAVRAQDLRTRRRVRWFRLAGHAALPRTIEFDAD
jgi:hypothetical protein